MQGEDVDRKEDGLWNFFGRQYSTNSDMARPACPYESVISVSWRDHIKYHGLGYFRLSGVLWAMSSSYGIGWCSAIILPTPMCKLQMSIYGKQKALRLHSTGKNELLSSLLKMAGTKYEVIHEGFVKKPCKSTFDRNSSQTWMQPKLMCQFVSSAAKYFEWQWTYDDPEIRHIWFCPETTNSQAFPLLWASYRNWILLNYMRLLVEMNCGRYYWQ